LFTSLSPLRRRPFFLCASVVAACAAALLLPARPAAAQFSLSFVSGTSKTADSDLRIAQPASGTDITFRDVKWKTRPFSGSIYYGYRLEYFLPNKPLGFDLDVNHNKVYSNPDQVLATSGTFQGQPVSGDTRLGDRVQEFRITNGVNTIAFDVLYRFAVRPSARYPFGRVTPYVGGGPAYFVLWSASTVAGKVGGHRYENSGFGFQLKAGARYHLTPDVALFGELKYTDGNGEVSVANGGTASTDLRTVHTVAGLAYTF